MNKEFSIRNLTRSESPNGFNHKVQEWSSSDWMVAMFVEFGEAANILKKLNRYRDNIPGNKETKEVLEEKLAGELADGYIYLDLFCQSRGIDLYYAVVTAFDKKSKEIGYIES